MVSVDATGRARPNGISGAEFLRLLKSTVKVAVMADISNLDEGQAAADIGADYVSTTLSGYTEKTKHANGLPDLDLVKSISSRVSTPVIAEGRIWSPDQARAAMELGAYAVCVGTVITRPVEIVRKFASSLTDRDR